MPEQADAYDFESRRQIRSSAMKKNPWLIFMKDANEEQEAKQRTQGLPEFKVDQQKN